MKAKKEVIKHSAAIHIQTHITLLQRRAWNVLLAYAYDELPVHEIYTIRVRELAALLEFDSKNDEYLREALEALVGCRVKWNILGKDHHWEWGVTTLLAHVIIKNGLCTYSYSPPLRERLHNPSMYARISLSMQNKFDSKHAQALWELCVDYLNEAKHYGETPFISLETFKDLMGLAGSKYASDFKILNRDVIKSAVQEINRLTDFRVEVDYQRQGRRVRALKFKVHRELELPYDHRKQSLLFPDLEDMPVAVQLMKEVGLSAPDAWQIYQQSFNGVAAGQRPSESSYEPESAFVEYIREKIDLLKRRQAAGKVESATGFLLAAIKQNYPNPEFAKAAGQRHRAGQAQAEAERQAALERRFEAHREQVFWQRFGERPEAWQAEQRQRFEALLAGDPVHRFVWQSYREHQSLQAPSVSGVFMAMLEDELLSQPEEKSLAAFAAWEEGG